MAFLNTQQEFSLWKRIYGNFAVADSGCWAWTGKNKKDKYGYTYLSVGSKGEKLLVLGVYRAMYALIYGLPEKGLHLDHLCRNVNCLNPKHLEPVTPQENQIRSPISLYTINSGKAECKHGHKLTPENTYTPPSRQNRRYCRTCKSLSNRKVMA